MKSIIDLQQQAKINSDVMRGMFAVDTTLLHFRARQLTLFLILAVAELVSGAGVADPEAAFLERYEAALSAYKSKSDPERFAGNEDYKKFREEVWNVTHPGVALPDEGPVDEDADIVVGTQTISLLCPYSKTMLVDPVANPDCNHVYSRANVMSQIPEADGKVEVRSVAFSPWTRRKLKATSPQCPVVGCQRRFFTRNLVVRKDIAKQVARQKRQREENRDEGSEEEGYETYH